MIASLALGLVAMFAWPVEFSINKHIERIDAGPVWGDTVDGLQLAVSGINQDGHFKSGDTIRFRLSVRNVGTEVIRFEYNHPKTCYWVAPHIERANGELVTFPLMRFRGGHRIFTETLEPNAVVSIQVSGILVLGASDTAQKYWPRIEKPESGEYRLSAGYYVQLLDANGKPVIQRAADGTRIAEYTILTSETVTFHID